MERSNNGRVTETYLPDGTKIVGYKEKRELEGYNKFELSDNHLLYMSDGSVVQIKSTGQIILISANDRVALSEKGLTQPNSDINYFLQLFGVPEERKGGVYTSDLVKSNHIILILFFIVK